MYADDLKIYHFVETLRDAIRLHLDSLSSWCQRNKLNLNILKCKVVSFHRKNSPIIFEYKIQDKPLNRLKVMNDLGVLFDEKVCFANHIKAMVSKAYSRLGFMKRICIKFDDPYCLKSVYVSLIRSILEYSSVIWNPGYANYNERIESIQKKFLLYALRHLGWRRDSFTLPSYESRCRLIDMESLSDRRNKASLYFMFDLLNGHIDAPDLLSFFSFRVPSRSFRQTNLMHVPL